MAVPMNDPPLCKPSSPNKPILALSPLSLHHFGTWKLHLIAYFLTCKADIIAHIIAAPIHAF